MGAADCYSRNTHARIIADYEKQAAFAGPGKGLTKKEMGDCRTEQHGEAASAVLSFFFNITL